jgi:pimeloyl-ACP methyl ester carboxylesterase
MSTVSESGATRVRSRHGCDIAWFSTGSGPPLVVVHGSPAEHTRWRPLLPHLEPHVTVHAIDRRGRGASGDGPAYTIAREYEDVAAVVEAVAATSGSDVDVYGHSFGASCALGAATLTSRLRRLALYEPPVRPTSETYPAGMLELMDRYVADGQLEALVELVFRSELDMTDEELAAFKAQPSWAARVAAAPTIPRETRAEMAGAFDLGQAAGITVPTLLFTGDGSPDWLRTDTELLAARLPNVHVQVLKGQDHVADVLAPDSFAGHLLAFLDGART